MVNHPSGSHIIIIPMRLPTLEIANSSSVQQTCREQALLSSSTSAACTVRSTRTRCVSCTCGWRTRVRSASRRRQVHRQRALCVPCPSTSSQSTSRRCDMFTSLLSSPNIYWVVIIGLCVRESAWTYLLTWPARGTVCWESLGLLV